MQKQFCTRQGIDSCELGSVQRRKKYSKVNEDIRDRFLQLIIEDNRSIKDASQLLNINYSSAKALLSNHRKSVFSLKRTPPKGRLIAHARWIQPAVQSVHSVSEFICSTGGKQTNRFTPTPKPKLIPSPQIIIPTPNKSLEYLENTSNSHFE